MNTELEKTSQISFRIPQELREEFRQYGGSSRILRLFVETFVKNRKKELNIALKKEIK